MSRPIKLALATAVALLVLAVGVTVGVIAAGGSGDEEPVGSNTGAASSDPFRERPDGNPPEFGGDGGAAPDPQALESFRDCLKDQGVDVPEPGSGQRPDFDREGLRRALEACRDELPSDIQPRGGDLQ